MHDNITFIKFVAGSAAILLAAVVLFALGMARLLDRVFAKARKDSPTVSADLRSREDHGLIAKSSSPEMEAWHAENQARLDILKPSQFTAIEQITTMCNLSDRLRKRE